MLDANLIVKDAVVGPGLHESCSHGIYIILQKNWFILLYETTRKIIQIFHNLLHICLSEADVCPDQSGHASLSDLSHVSSS
jgi:hypothetical protein